MSEETPEVQDEMTEVLEEAQETEVLEEQEVLEEGQEEEVKPPEIDKTSPTYLAGEKAMQDKMQAGMDRRIGKEVRKTKDLNLKVQALEERFTNLDREKVEALPMPTIDDYLDQPNPEASFYEAMGKRSELLKTVAKKPEAAPQAQPELSQAAIDYTAKEDIYADANPTYINDVNIAMRYMNEKVQEALYDTDPQTVHALSKDLNRVQQLSTMTPSQIGREIAKFEISNKQGKPLPKRAQGKPEPTSNNRGTTVKTGSLDGLSQEAYNKAMRELP